MKKIILLIVSITISTISDYIQSDEPLQKESKEEVEKKSEYQSQKKETKIELIFL